MITLIPSSYIKLQANGYYFTNDEEFDPTSIWYDTNSILYYCITRYDNTDKSWKIITNGKLNGYNNNTDYSYRFNFDKYIKIIQDREPNIIKVNDEQQYFDSFDNCNLYFTVATFDIIATSYGNITVKSNGEMWITDPNLLSRNVLHDNFIFYDKVDGNSLQFPTCDKLYQNSYVPITMNNFTSTSTAVGMESENLLINSKSRSFGDNGPSSTKTNIKSESGFVRYTPMVGTVVNIYANLTDLTKELVYGQKFSASMWVRSSQNATLTYTVRSTDQTETYSYQNYELLQNTWTKIFFNNVTVTNKCNNGIQVLCSLNVINSILDMRDNKIEQNSISTDWTPASTNVTPFISDFYTYSTITAYNKNGLVTKYLETLQPTSSSRTWLQYLDETDTKVYFQNGDNGRFINVLPSTCNTTPWYFKGINGGIDVLYTNGNQHEISNVTKDYITIDNKKYNHNINTQKQLKANTGFEMNEPQIRSLIKSPFMLKPTWELPIINRNLLTNSSFLNGQDFWSNNSNPNSISNGILNLPSGTSNGLYIYQYFEPGVIYTLSAKVRRNSGTTGSLLIAQASYTQSDLPLGVWVTKTQVYVGLMTNSGTQLIYATHNGLSDMDIDIKEFKVEKGLATTPWTPAPEDNYLQNYLKGTSNVHGNFTSKMYELGKDFKVDSTTYYPLDTFYLSYWYLCTYLTQTIQICDADGGRAVTIFNQAIQSTPNEAGNTIVFDASLVGTRTHIKITHSSAGSIRSLQLTKNASSYNWSANQEELPNYYPLRIENKRYMLDTTSFEGYNGSKLSEKNIELILTDEKISKRKSNFELNFFD